MASSIPARLPSSAKSWNWQGFNICYQNQGSTGRSILMVHDFGASWKHWRKNIPVLTKNSRVYAIDLLGFGASDKPQPGNKLNYTFDIWGQQITDFCREIIRDPVFLVGNSIGCIVAMQAAVNNPDLVLGVALINCSLRLMHEQKRKNLPLFWRIGTPLLQKCLTFKPLGEFFFKRIANPSTIRNILLQAYIHREAVTDELVEIITSPARNYGAADVFIAFTSYSSGPLAEDLLPKLKCPAIILWGVC